MTTLSAIRRRCCCMLSRWHIGRCLSPDTVGNVGHITDSIKRVSQRFFIHSCIYLRILIISYLATFLCTNSLSVQMCRKALSCIYDWKMRELSLCCLTASSQFIGGSHWTACHWIQTNLKPSSLAPTAKWRFPRSDWSRQCSYLTVGKCSQSWCRDWLHAVFQCTR